MTGARDVTADVTPANGHVIDLLAKGLHHSEQYCAALAKVALIITSTMCLVLDLIIRQTEDFAGLFMV